MKKQIKLLLCILLAVSFTFAFCSCSNEIKEIDKEIERLQGLDVEFTDMYLINSVKELVNRYEKLSKSDKNKIANATYMNELINLLPKMKTHAHVVTKSIKRFQQNLKDPSSIKYSDNYLVGYCLAEENLCAIKIKYNAKNSFGAYAGESTSYVIYQKENGVDNIKIYDSSETYLFLSMGYNPSDMKKDDRITKFIVSQSILEEIQDGEFDLY